MTRATESHLCALQGNNYRTRSTSHHSVPTCCDEDVTLWLNTHWLTPKVTHKFVLQLPWLSKSQERCDAFQVAFVSILQYRTLAQGQNRNFLADEPLENHEAGRQISLDEHRA